MVEGEHLLQLQLVPQVERGEDGGELEDELEAGEDGVHDEAGPRLGRRRHEAHDGEEEEENPEGDDEVGNRREVAGYSNVDQGEGDRVPGEEEEAGEKVEVDEDAAEVDEGGGGAEEEEVDATEEGLVDAHPG